MDHYAGEIIDGIYAHTEGSDDVALVQSVLDRVRAEARQVERERVVSLEAALRGMLEHCSCQGRGYRSWDNGAVVKPCSSVTCLTARLLLGIPETAARYPSNSDSGTGE